LFCLERTSPDGREKVLCLHNVGAKPALYRVQADAPPTGAGGSRSGGWIDLISGRPVVLRWEPGQAWVELAPYEALWLVSRPPGPAAAAPPRPADRESPDPETLEHLRVLRHLYRPLHPMPTELAPRGRLRRPVRAVLFDVYGTLWVSAAGDLDHRGREDAAGAPGLQDLLDRYGCPRSPQELARELAAAIREEHARRRAEGTAFPEVRIERIWAKLLGLDPARARAFAVEYEARVNPVWPMPGLRSALRSLRRRGLALGILSNAQFHMPLLFDCFLGADARALGFRDELLLYSFELECAKPSPWLFETARQRLEALGIPAGRVLMVGNDALRDLAPARAAGFQTALFAGDARSLRGAEQADRATAVVTDLRQLPRLLGRGPAARS
jgi:putative hydrolase of the HAD superfamily